jgi:probable phosphoglycerate mutase
MPIIYLLRHAQSTANSKGILAGQDNAVELSKTGFNQALDLIPRIEEIRPVKIYSSPLTRCLQTIAPYMQKYPKTKFEINENLIEMDYGSWSGRKLDDLRKLRAWKRVQKSPSSFTFPNGESFKSLRRRLDNSLSDVINEKGPLLFVSHGDVIKMALAKVVGIKIDNFQKFVVEPGSISVIAVEPKNSSILASNTLTVRSIGKYWRPSQLGGGDFLKRSRPFRKK